MVSAGVRALFEKHKVGVLLPTYNNAQTLGSVLSSVLEYTDQVIVVNDGSTDTTLEILKQFPQIDLISYPANQGKGFALRKGFQRAVEAGYDYVISIDSDGQHYADDLPLFLNKLETNPSAIIIGVRNMEHASVPGKSSFGNKSSSFWFWVMTGLKMNDTQSGYRLYPVRQLKDIRFITKKFEFEIEVLVLSAWRGVAITEVPIRVFYPEKGKLQFTDVTVDPATGAVQLRAIFPNHDTLLLPGLYVRATINQGINPKGILVPQNAVGHNQKGEPTALVVDEKNFARLRLLKTGRAVGGTWQVLEGLKPGDRLITEGLAKVVPDMPVNPQPAGQASKPAAGR